MASMIHIDWPFILFTLLAVGSAAGGLLCIRHMMHEGSHKEKEKERHAG